MLKRLFTCGLLLKESASNWAQRGVCFQEIGRLAKKQKEYFEYAANLGGFKTLTDFVIFSGEQQANQIVEKHNTILASKRDQEVFFDALMNPPPANEIENLEFVMDSRFFVFRPPQKSHFLPFVRWGFGKSKAATIIFPEFRG